MSPSLPERPSGRRLALASASIAAAVATFVCLPSAPGLLGLAGLLLALAAIASAGVGLMVVFPQALVGLVPALIPSPMFLLTFAWELALVLLAVLMVVQGWRSRAPWLQRLDRVELPVVMFTAFALFSGFWSADMRLYVIGARLLLMGMCAMWVASRLPEIAPRRWFDFGLIGGASALGVAAVFRSLTSGLSSSQALLHRPEVTNLGWGTANYVASLLLICAPSLLRLALRGRSPERALAGVAFAIVTLVQLIVASRAATVLFIVGTLLQLLRAGRRFRLWVGLGFAGGLTLIVLSPHGYGLMSRLDNVRELGSMTIRLWYFREGWRRLLEHLPWGLGLWQGYGNGDHLQGIDPHNYWLLLGGDLGVLGILLWAVVMVALARGWWATRNDEPGREQAHTLLITLALMNLHTLVEPTFQGPHYQLLFYWVMFGTLAYARAEQHRGVAAVPLASRATPGIPRPATAPVRSGA